MFAIRKAMAGALLAVSMFVFAPYFPMPSDHCTHRCKSGFDPIVRPMSSWST